MRLIVGLGNPGRQYDNTPHNVGFHAIDELAQRHAGNWALQRRFDAMTAEVRIWDRNTTLLKPLTYMNLSGQSVGAWLSRNGGEPSEILVISDDVHLPLGRIRIRTGGSHGGQKGLLSIINSLGTLEFPRLRIGIRPETEEVTDLVEYVLRKVKPADRDVFKQSWSDAADAVEMIFKKDLTTAMNHFNRKNT
ncbi:MAG: aminoacyl-tRNA hydrolase [Candidatus Sumerlaeaceae bacterium]